MFPEPNARWLEKLSRRSKRSKSAPRRRPRPTLLALERLEDRTLLTNWTAIGPAPVNNGTLDGLHFQPWTGRITGLAADPGDANTIYIAAAGGGVWKTSNGGTSWTPLTDSQSTLFMG